MPEYNELFVLLAIVVAYVFDFLLGDPIILPHPIVYFGKAIAFFEKRFNRGAKRLLKGALVSLLLIAGVYAVFYFIGKVAHEVSPYLYAIYVLVFFFYGIANRTLIKEGVAVFKVLDKQGLEAGRTQLSRIVGRDTSQLSHQQIRKAALETMAENLSDGVVAPIFWFALLGIPGMMMYKIINTLDSMIGYKNDRYLLFGRLAAYTDDVANYIPARLTAVLMAMVSCSYRAIKYIFKFGRYHSSPNAGYPEAALAGILNVQFGGASVYHGKVVEKPHIGYKDRVLGMRDVQITARINHLVCMLSVILCIIVRFVIIS